MSDARADPQLLLHPVRMRIVVALARGDPMTPQRLAARLPDVPPATLYRHLRVLAGAGVLSVVGERRIRGAVERTFALQRERASLGPADLAAATPEERMRAFTTFVAVLLADYAAVVRRSAAASSEAAFFVTPLQLTDEEFAAFGTELQAVLQRAMATPPSPTSRRRTLATILIADPAEPGETS
jgi:DNA-binding transcriptional ArsR family regulator